MIALQFSNLCVRWSARASKQNKKIHPPLADTVVDAQINVSGLPGARLRCFWVVLTAGQRVRRPRRDFINTPDLGDVRRVRIKLYFTLFFIISLFVLLYGSRNLLLGRSWTSCLITERSSSRKSREVEGSFVFFFVTIIRLIKSFSYTLIIRGTHESLAIVANTDLCSTALTTYTDSRKYLYTWKILQICVSLIKTDICKTMKNMLLYLAKFTESFCVSIIYVAIMVTAEKKILKIDSMLKNFLNCQRMKSLDKDFIIHAHQNL